MKRLIILLLIVGCVFGDTIVYKSGRNNRTIENVEYIKAGDGKVYFKAHGGEIWASNRTLDENGDVNISGARFTLRFPILNRK